MTKTEIIMMLVGRIEYYVENRAIVEMINKDKTGAEWYHDQILDVKQEIKKVLEEEN